MKLLFTMITILTLFININGCAEQNVSEDKLSSELMQLATSENPEDFAKRHGIPLINNSVKVTIVAKNESPDLTKRYNLKEIKRHKNLIEANVSIKDLISLSKEKEIEYIRRPYKLWKW